ncbi:MAG: methyltransferase domain-containing protein [Candidatus Hydrogenedentes bacterium]|nr:methyltransferase domain-containing protein [Candidatus Hydrogenedentota bacterium]
MDVPHHISPTWYEDAFGDYYEIVYAHRTIEAALPEVAFVASVLSVTREDRVLDLCCGTGRHLYHMAQVSNRSFGLDYSPALLTRARATLGSAASLVRADMRQIPFANTFDVVTSFFTSFGYFDDEDENALVLHEIARVLRRNGRFFLDHANAPHLRATLVPASARTQGGYEIQERRWIDEERSRINKNTHVFRDGVEVHRSEESVRLYGRRELQDLLGKCGLRVDHVYGDHTGSLHTDASPRMLVAGHKE